MTSACPSLLDYQKTGAAPILPEMVVAAAMLRHPGPNWHEGQAERKAEADREAQRVANYYRRQQREKEDMENARARARAEQARPQAAST